MKRQQSGFGVVESVIAIAVLVLIGIGGWYVWAANQKSQTAEEDVRDNASYSNDQSTGETTASQGQTLALASDHVYLTLPAGWSAGSGRLSGDACIVSLGSACVDQATIFPGDTGAVGGDPNHPKFVGVTTAVYKRDGGISAKDWWNQHRKDENTPLASVEATDALTTTIGGYDTYSFTLDAGAFADRRYVIAAQNYLILIDAPAKGAGATGVDDYSDYLPSIRTFIESIKIR